jgi:hypothetical protein
LVGSVTRVGERGGALLIVLVVVVIVTLSGALAHRRALDTLREGRTALAVLKAREAAESGLTRAANGGPLAGSLPGGTTWIVTVDTTPSGDRILRSVGSSSVPYPATSEALALVDSAGKSVMASVTVRR